MPEQDANVDRACYLIQQSRCRTQENSRFLTSNVWSKAFHGLVFYTDVWERQRERTYDH